MTEQVLAVQRMQDYIEAHLDEEIGLADLARASLFSPWHAHRLFRTYLGMAPAEYVRRLRLSRSALALKRGDRRITDVALALGFGSVDGYTRAFARTFGMTPSQYARDPVPITLFVPYGAKFRALRKERTTMAETKHIFLQVIHKPAHKVVLKRGVAAEDYFPYCEEVGCDVWGTLLSMDSLSASRSACGCRSDTGRRAPPSTCRAWRSLSTTTVRSQTASTRSSCPRRTI